MEVNVWTPQQTSTTAVPVPKNASQDKPAAKGNVSVPLAYPPVEGNAPTSKPTPSTAVLATRHARPVKNALPEHANSTAPQEPTRAALPAVPPVKPAATTGASL